MKRIVSLLLLAGAGVAVAAERPADFAYGIAIDVSGNEALYEVTLPAVVYRGVVRPDLGDLRAFNGTGEVVPHAFRPHRTTRPDAPATVPLTLFPLKAQAGTSVDGLSISVRRSDRGVTSVDVRSVGPSGSAEKRIIGYLIDLSVLDRGLRSMELEWRPVADGFAGKLRVDASDDLAAWRTVVTGAPLVNLEVAGQRLQQKRVELPPQKVKYLRLSWVAPGVERQTLPELETARGELAEKTVEAPRAWTRIEAGKGEKPGEYVFDVRGHYPVDRVRFDLPEPNTVVQVQLLTRDKADQSWRQAARGVIYRLRQAGSEIASPDLATGTVSDRYWLLRVDQRGGGIGSGIPIMHAGFVPHALVFAARGEPPFQLVYGNREAKSAAYAIETLIPGYRDDASQQIRAAKTGSQQTVSVRTAEALAQQELGGEARRQDAIDWKRWSLWGALVLGVLILGVMAWRLLRQINSQDAAKSESAEKH